jgi:hypothetical protein
MRRLMLMLIAIGLLGGSLAGCHTAHSRGICDCEEDDHCLERQPWLRLGVPSTSESIPTPPSKLPDGKKKDL